MKLSRSLWLHGKIHVTIAIQIIFFHHAGGQRRYGRFLFENRMFVRIRPGLIPIHKNLLRLPATPARPWKGHTDRFQRQLSHGISIIIKILRNDPDMKLPLILLPAQSKIRLLSSLIHFRRKGFPIPVSPD